MTEFSVYGLFDPEEPEVLKYIGSTSAQLSKRVADHVSEIRFRLKHKKRLTAPKMVWLVGLLKEQRVPGIRLLGTAPSKAKAEQLEQVFINESPDCLNVKAARGSGGRPVGTKKPREQRATLIGCLRDDLRKKYFELRLKQGYPEPELSVHGSTANRKHYDALAKSGSRIRVFQMTSYDVQI